MSREIKFRAWSEYSNQMVSWDAMIAEETSGSVLNGDDIKIHVMQYTGLKDKNGKEIFEGDIVRTWEETEHIPNRDSGGGIIDYDQREGFSQLGVVDFKGALFTYETKKHLEGRKEEIYAPLDFTNELEVIGNIYENPELLEITA